MNFFNPAGLAVPYATAHANYNASIFRAGINYKF